jgi:hypothetical protein
MDNVIYLQFLSKTHFPAGEWQREPDYCEWSNDDYKCLAIRDMVLGNWCGFVGVSTEHFTFGKSIKASLDEGWGLTLSVHGGISFMGKLPLQYKELNKGKWWFGFECSQGVDIIPVMSGEATPAQTYRNLVFVRKEANQLVKQLSILKREFIGNAF